MNLKCSMYANINNSFFFNFSLFSEKNLRLVFTMSRLSKVCPLYKFSCNLGFYPILTLFIYTSFSLFSLRTLQIISCKPHSDSEVDIISTYR